MCFGVLQPNSVALHIDRATYKSTSKLFQSPCRKKSSLEYSRAVLLELHILQHQFPVLHKTCGTDFHCLKSIGYLDSVTNCPYLKWAMKLKNNFGAIYCDFWQRIWIEELFSQNSLIHVDANAGLFLFHRWTGRYSRQVSIKPLYFVKSLP